MTDPEGRPAPTPDLEDWLADAIPEPATGDESFTLDSDGKATWAFRKRRGYATELDRLRGLAAAERAKIDAWEDDATSGLVSRLEWFDGMLEGYYRRLHDADPDLPKSYRVPGGTIGRRKAPDALEVSGEPEAVEWLGENRPDLLRVAVDKAATKKALTAPDLADAAQGARLDLVDADTGEIVPGLVWVVGADRIFTKPEADA